MTTYPLPANPRYNAIISDSPTPYPSPHGHPPSPIASIDFAALHLHPITNGTHQDPNLQYNTTTPPSPNRHHPSHQTSSRLFNSDGTTTLRTNPSTAPTPLHTPRTSICERAATPGFSHRRQGSAKNPLNPSWSKSLELSLQITALRNGSHGPANLDGLDGQVNGMSTTNTGMSSTSAALQNDKLDSLEATLGELHSRLHNCEMQVDASSATRSAGLEHHEDNFFHAFRPVEMLDIKNLVNQAREDVSALKSGGEVEGGSGL